MRFLAALMLWLLTTVTLAAAVPAVWAQLHLVDEDGYAALAAEAAGVALLLPGHYASERPGVEDLAAKLAADFPSLTVWASQRETDPLKIV